MERFSTIFSIFIETLVLNEKKRRKVLTLRSLCRYFWSEVCFSLQVEPRVTDCRSHLVCVLLSLDSEKYIFLLGQQEHVQAGVKCVLNPLFDAGIISNINIVEIMEGHQEDDGWQVKKKKQRPAPAPVVVEDTKSKPLYLNLFIKPFFKLSKTSFKSL